MTQLATLGTMAKKKTTQPKREDKNKPIIATLRGSEAFKEYLEKAAKADRSSVAVYLERAAISYAKQIGVTDEPPDR